MTRPASDEPSALVRRLPIGERLPLGEVVNDPLFPFEADTRLQPLAAPLLPEPIRRGAHGGDPCPACRARPDAAIWEDERWWVIARVAPSGLPMAAVLQPHAHHDLEDLPPDLAADLGSMIQRVVRAIGRIGGVGRVHVDRWADGSEHFHLWFLARPRGMWQMRGAMLAVWDDVLPRIPTDEWAVNRRTVAAALAEEGGRILTAAVRAAIVAPDGRIEHVSSGWASRRRLS